MSREAGEPGRATYLAELRSLDFNHTSKMSSVVFRKGSAFVRSCWRGKQRGGGWQE